MQKKAAQTTDGKNMLIAVPGSGKTTVLVARLGYMVFCKGISPREILAVTYTRAASADMRERFAKYFGRETADRIKFCTLNSISLAVCRMRFGERLPKMIDDTSRKKLLVDILQGLMEDYPADSDITAAENLIGYAKNMLLDEKAISALDAEVPQPLEIMKRYKRYLNENRLMDFDDQMIYAMRILRSDPAIAARLRQRFRYISVDEVQDVSKLQHEIIKLLVSDETSLFMVGDEDQSIYGFRGAFPEAMLRCREDYKDAGILFMEQNYRSAAEIVEKAAGFISRCTQRYDKKIVPVRGSGGTVVKIPSAGRSGQYDFLLKQFRDFDEAGEGRTAVLYRTNDSIIPLADSMFREGIPFCVKASGGSFFTHRVTSDMTAFLTLALDPYDTEAFMRIYYKCSMGIKKDDARSICYMSESEGMSVFQAMEEHFSERSSMKQRVRNFISTMKQAASASSRAAVSIIYRNIYSGYMERRELDSGKIDILTALAANEPVLSRFMVRLQKLPMLMAELPSDGERIVFSTVHSSKGLEYDTVYIIDVFDGAFPANDDPGLYQEERRLFYVAVTRAKERLFIFGLEDRKTSFTDEIFPRPKLSERKQPSSGYLEKALGKNSAEKKVNAAAVALSGSIICEGASVTVRSKGEGKIISVVKDTERSRHKVTVEFADGTCGNYVLEIALNSGNMVIHTPQQKQDSPI